MLLSPTAGVSDGWRPESSLRHLLSNYSGFPAPSSFVRKIVQKDPSTGQWESRVGGQHDSADAAQMAGDYDSLMIGTWT